MGKKEKLKGYVIFPSIDSPISKRNFQIKVDIYLLFQHKCKWGWSGCYNLLVLCILSFVYKVKNVYMLQVNLFLFIKTKIHISLNFDQYIFVDLFTTPHILHHAFSPPIGKSVDVFSYPHSFINTPHLLHYLQFKTSFISSLLLSIFIGFIS